MSEYPVNCLLTWNQLLRREQTSEAPAGLVDSWDANPRAAWPIHPPAATDNALIRVVAKMRAANNIRAKLASLHVLARNGNSVCESSPAVDVLIKTPSCGAEPVVLGRRLAGWPL